MSVSRRLDGDLDHLPMDVFDLADSGLVVESLTSGHGMAELGGSCSCSCPCPCSGTCACCSCPPL